MRILRTIAELRDALAEARRAVPGGVGLVPTMGALHEGHLSLVRAARAAHGTVVLSIFVNPTQFTEAADLAAYPRDEARDAELAAGAGVDLVFAPDAAEMYPAGHATTVHVGGRLTETLEGAGRGAAHFDGAATIVAKLLLAAQPDAAYFGEKDAQQVLVVQRMVADLGIPVRIVPCPTSRDDDGLARSSRNVRLSASERSRALAIPRALEAVRAAAEAGERSIAALRATALAELSGAGSGAAERAGADAGVDVEYVELVDARTLEPLAELDRPVRCAIAARVGGVRLIDNERIVPARVDPAS